jgi:hypothetical protein
MDLDELSPIRNLTMLIECTSIVRVGKRRYNATR